MTGGDSEMPTGSEGPEASTGKKEYDVGYRKPPVSGRFLPGKSGNPAGRPKKVDAEASLLDRPAQKVLQEEFYRPIKIRDGGDRGMSIPAVQAVARSAVRDAIKGSSHAQRTVLQMTKQLEEEAERRRDQNLSAWLKVIAKAEELIALGIPEEEMPIHPDDIQIDFETGRVEIADASTPEGRERVRALVAIRDEQQTIILRGLETLAVDGPHDLLYLGRWVAQHLFDEANARLPRRFRKALKGRLSKGSPTPRLLPPNWPPKLGTE